MKKTFLYVGLPAVFIILSCNNPQTPVEVTTSPAQAAEASVSSNLPAPKEVAMKIMEALKNKDYNAYVACGRTAEDMKPLMRKMGAASGTEMTEDKIEETVKRMSENDQAEMKKTFDDFMAACEANKIDLASVQITIGEETVNQAMEGVETVNLAVELKDNNGIYTSAVDLIKTDRAWVINFPGATQLMKQ